MDRTKEVIDIIARETRTEPNTIFRTTNLKDDLFIDELECVEIVICLEEELGIEIEDDEAQNWETVGDIIDCVNQKTGEQEGE